VISILIPHYNNPEIIRPCLESLHHLSRLSPPHEIVVIDDGSTDESPRRIRGDFPSIRLIEQAENLGFVRAIQQGIQETEGELLVFLNNDTWVEPDWLIHLVDPLLSGQVQGSTGSILMDWEGRKALFKGVSVNYLGYGFEEQGELPDPNGTLFPVLCTCGGAMAISRSLYQDVGGFDESYGMVYEDLDLGWRLNLWGYQCVLVPASRVGHRAHTSLGRTSFERKARYYLQNPIRTIFKNWDEADHLEHIQMVVTLAQARERICLYAPSSSSTKRGKLTLKTGFWEQLGSLFQKHHQETPLIDALVREEEQTRELAHKRKIVQKRQKYSTRELFACFVSDPTRPWFFNEEQRLLLEGAGYWELEKRLYREYGIQP
jgi:GT2 family glycosyltransferase